MTDDELAALFAPRGEDDVLPDGARVLYARFRPDRPEAVVRVAFPPVDLLLRSHGPQEPALRTAHFDATVRLRGEHTPASREVVRRLLARLAAHDRPEGPAPDWVPGSRPLPPSGTLWLVPGHLGATNDLTRRALRLLASAAALVTERGPSTPLHKLLGDHGLAVGDRPVWRLTAEATAPRVVETLRTGGDVVVFGEDEGVPGFADPGSQLVAQVTAAVGDRAVRSVGGASVLGTALMRVPVTIDRFTCLGAVDGLDHGRRDLLDDLDHAVSRGGWAAVLSPVGPARALVRAWSRHRDAPVRAIACVALTRPGERVLDEIIGPATTPVFHGPRDGAPAVVFLRPAPRDGRPDGPSHAPDHGGG